MKLFGFVKKKLIQPKNFKQVMFNFGCINVSSISFKHYIINFVQGWQRSQHEYMTEKKFGPKKPHSIFCRNKENQSIMHAFFHGVFPCHIFFCFDN